MEFFSDLGLLYELFHVPIESLQMMSLSFVPEIGWSPKIFDGMQDMNVMRLDIDGPSFLALFYIFCSVTLIFFVLGLILTQVELCEGLPDMLW